jgi:hypothetical protein
MCFEANCTVDKNTTKREKLTIESKERIRLALAAAKQAVFATPCLKKQSIIASATNEKLQLLHVVKTNPKGDSNLSGTMASSN